MPSTPNAESALNLEPPPLTPDAKSSHNRLPSCKKIATSDSRSKSRFEFTPYDLVPILDESVTHEITKFDIGENIFA